MSFQEKSRQRNPNPPREAGSHCFRLTFLLLLCQGDPGTKNVAPRLLKMYLLLSLLCLLSLGFLRQWPSVSRALASNRTCAALERRGRRNLTVLLWYWPFDKPLSLSGDVCWDEYGVPGCRLVSQRSLFPAADVVVFHNRELLQRPGELPLHLPRPAGQRWAWMSLEAPTSDLRRYSNIFNMTMSYRRDADVPIPYGELQRGATRDHAMGGVPSNKSFLACWVVSHYAQHHKRSKVYRELKALIPVQVYGQWTKTPLSSRALLPTISRCSFYLAFENTISRDYITEKLWRNSYQGGAVPVVLGPPVEEYAAVAPPHSFVHTDQFASTKALADYLQQLATDQQRYGHYFSWRRDWNVKLLSDWRERLCRICSRFSRLAEHRVYTDLHGWVRALHIRPHPRT